MDCNNNTEILSECPVCGCPQFKALAIPDVIIGYDHFAGVMSDLLLVKCRVCGHIYQKVRPSEDLLNSFYVSSESYAPFGTDRDTIGAIADRIRMSFINKFEDNFSLVDLGGGAGRFAKTLKTSGIEAVVVEMSPVGREQCSRIGVDAFATILSAFCISL